MIAKPKLLKAQERANQVYEYMKSKNVVTKPEICAMLGWQYNSGNDRRVREIIALLASKKPIVATSDRKGYSLPVSKESVQHEINELKSRIAELAKRIKPLEDYIESQGQVELF